MNCRTLSVIWTDGRRRTSGLPVMRRVPYAGQVSRTCSVRSIRAMRAEGASGSNAMLMGVSGSGIRPVVPCVRTWDVEYASVTPADGNAPVRPGGSPDMSDRGRAMRGWTEPVRYGLICPCPYGMADARVLSDAVRPGREAGVYVRFVLETAVPASYRIVRPGASGSTSVPAGIRKDMSVLSPFRTPFLSALPVSLGRCGSVTDGTGRPRIHNGDGCVRFRTVGDGKRGVRDDWRMVSGGRRKM